MIELMYALQVSGVFHKSATDVKVIVTYFEKIFNVDLGNYTELFEISGGEKKGKTVFLDELRCKLGERLDQPMIFEAH